MLNAPRWLARYSPTSGSSRLRPDFGLLQRQCLLVLKQDSIASREDETLCHAERTLACLFVGGLVHWLLPVTIHPTDREGMVGCLSSVQWEPINKDTSRELKVPKAFFSSLRNSKPHPPCVLGSLY